MNDLPGPMPEYATMPGSAPSLVRDEIIDILTRSIAGSERSLQKALGPSEIGQPCARRIGYTLLDHPEVNTGAGVAWKPWVGTQCHTGMEDTLARDNARHYLPDGTRWITEATLFCGLVNGVPLLGHCDAYDQVTFGVLDWKFVGPTQLKKYKAKGPGDQYRSQAHTYGRGWKLAQRRVDWVGVLFFPRDGQLEDAHLWHEPYEDQVALDAIARADNIARMTAALGEAALPLLPTADQYCRLCPFHRRNSPDVAQACPGHATGDNPVSGGSFADLLGGQ